MEPSLANIVNKVNKATGSTYGMPKQAPTLESIVRKVHAGGGNYLGNWEDPLRNQEFAKWAESAYKDYNFSELFGKKRSRTDYRYKPSNDQLENARALFERNMMRASQGLDDLALGSVDIKPWDFDEDTLTGLSGYYKDTGAMPADEKAFGAWRTKTKYKKEYDLTTPEDQANYEQGLLPLKYQVTEKAKKEEQDYLNELQKAYDAGTLTTAAMREILKKYPTLSLLDSYAKEQGSKAEKAKLEADMAGGAADYTSILGSKTEKSKFDLEGLKALEYDPLTGFDPLIKRLTDMNGEAQAAKIREQWQQSLAQEGDKYDREFKNALASAQSGDTQALRKYLDANPGIEKYFDFSQYGGLEKYKKDYAPNFWESLLNPAAPNADKTVKTLHDISNAIRDYNPNTLAFNWLITKNAQTAQDILTNPSNMAMAAIEGKEIPKYKSGLTYTDYLQQNEDRLGAENPILTAMENPLYGQSLTMLMEGLSNPTSYIGAAELNALAKTGKLAGELTPGTLGYEQALKSGKLGGKSAKNGLAAYDKQLENWDAQDIIKAQKAAREAGATGNIVDLAGQAEGDAVQLAERFGNEKTAPTLSRSGNSAGQAGSPLDAVSTNKKSSPSVVGARGGSSPSSLTSETSGIQNSSNDIISLSQQENQLKSQEQFDRALTRMQTGDAGNTLPEGRKVYNLVTKRWEDVPELNPRESLAARKANPQTQRMKQLYNDQKRLQGELDSKAQNYGLTATQKNQVAAVLRGEDTWDSLGQRVNSADEYYNMRDYAAKYQELDAVNSEIKQYNQARIQAMQDWADDLIANSDTWKDKKKLAYGRETWDRNIMDIAGGKDGARIRKEIFERVHRNEALRIKFVNEGRQMVKDLKLTKEESALVQQVGEGRIDLTAIPDAKTAARVQDAVDKLRAWYDEAFDQVNAVLVENGYKPVPKRANYFPHFQEQDTLLDRVKKAFGVDVMQTELPTDINGITHTFKPGKRWFGNFLQRTGENATMDAVQGFDRYVEGVSHVLYHTDDIQKLRSFIRALRGKYSEQGVKDAIAAVRGSGMDAEEAGKAIDDLLDKNRRFQLANAVSDLEDYTNVLAGKKSLPDRATESLLGRKVYSLSQNLENRIARNMVALNPGSWLTNFIPLTQATATQGSGTVLRAMMDTIKNVFADDGFVGRSAFLTARRGSDPLVSSAVSRISDVASAPMRWIDDFTSNVITRSKYLDGLKQGIAPEDAMRLADDWAAKAIGDRSLGAQPTLFNAKNPFIKPFTQFQLEVNNQLSFLFKDLPKELKGQGVLRTTAAIAKMAVFSYLYNEAYSALTGRRPAIDPIGVAVGFARDISGEDGDTGKAFANAGTQIANNIPFMALPGAALGIEDLGRLPISAAVPDITKLNTPQNAAKELAKPLGYLLPPVGGGQALKTAQGILALHSGGEYGQNAAGEKSLKFPLEPANLMTDAQAVLFGKYATPEGQRYINEGFPSLSQKQTAQYDELRAEGIPADPLWEAFLTLKGLKPEAGKNSVSDAQRKAAIMATKGLTGEQKLSIVDLVLYTPAMSPETQAKYDAMEAAGIPHDAALRIYTELNKLEPAAGHKAVTKEQKQRAVWGMAELPEEQRRAALTALGLMPG